MTSKVYTIDLEKDALRRTGDEVLLRQIEHVRTRITDGGRERRGWSAINNPIDRQYVSDGNVTSYKFCCTITIQCNPRNGVARTSYDKEFTSIVEVVKGAIKVNHWEIAKINGEEPLTESYTEDELLSMPSTYVQVEIPDDWQRSFEHLYERDAHINIIHDALEVAIDSGWKHRFHTLLFGPPGCGKSDILLSVKDMVGAESVLEFDATATTMAGATRELKERQGRGDPLPRLLLVEEIEKADENSLRWLLGMMDIRGSIRKLNFRTKTQIDAKMFTIATVNDVDLFKRMMSGALASRFSHQLYCPRPDRKLIGKILLREILEVDGNEAWIEPTLDYLDVRKITDPRKAMAICLTGRDRLLTGEFQKQMDMTTEGLPSPGINLILEIAEGMKTA